MKPDKALASWVLEEEADREPVMAPHWADGGPKAQLTHATGTPRCSTRPGCSPASLCPLFSLKHPYGALESGQKLCHWSGTDSLAC